ncbi:hypothetical protein [Devosia sp. LC5]|uniref:hypothetical protein n=1 Tax=Devosia sp. LC5 TaxID=1502724 RepID=UPI001267B65F|nr:hypothetical protein [Devosia sp. LC5]
MHFGYCLALLVLGSDPGHLHGIGWTVIVATLASQQAWRIGRRMPGRGDISLPALLADEAAKEFRPTLAGVEVNAEILDHLIHARGPAIATAPGIDRVAVNGQSRAIVPKLAQRWHFSIHLSADIDSTVNEYGTD